MKKLFDIFKSSARLSFKQKKVNKLTGLEEVIFDGAITNDIAEVRDTVNKYLYNYGYTFVNENMAKAFSKKFKTLLSQVNGCKCSKTYKDMAKAFLSERIGALDDYIELYTTDIINDKKLIQRDLDYRVQYYVKMKDDLDKDKMVNMMEVNKTLHHFLIKDGKYALNTKEFNDMQKELMDKLVAPYRF